MASSPTASEYRDFAKKIKEYSEKMAATPETARQALQAAGILDRDGKLAPQYRKNNV